MYNLKIPRNDVTYLKTSTTKTEERLNTVPPQVVHKYEREYIVSIKIDGYRRYFGFVVIDVDINQGKTYLEVFEINDEQAKFWQIAPGAKEERQGKEMPLPLYQEFVYLLEIMLNRQRTNIVVETLTPYKSAGEVREQTLMSELKEKEKKGLSSLPK